MAEVTEHVIANETQSLDQELNKIDASWVDLQAQKKQSAKNKKKNGKSMKEKDKKRKDKKEQQKQKDDADSKKKKGKKVDSEEKLSQSCKLTDAERAPGQAKSKGKPGDEVEERIIQGGWCCSKKVNPKECSCCPMDTDQSIGDPFKQTNANLKVLGDQKEQKSIMSAALNIRFRIEAGIFEPQEQKELFEVLNTYPRLLQNIPEKWVQDLLHPNYDHLVLDWFDLLTIDAAHLFPTVKYAILKQRKFSFNYLKSQLQGETDSYTQRFNFKAIVVQHLPKKNEIFNQKVINLLFEKTWPETENKDKEDTTQKTDAEEKKAYEDQRKMFQEKFAVLELKKEEYKRLSGKERKERQKRDFYENQKKQQLAQQFKNKAQPVKIKVLACNYNWTPGSKSSIRFHTGLKASGTTAQSAIYQSETIKHILHYKWNLTSWYNLFYSGQLVALLGVLMVSDYAFWCIIPFTIWQTFTLVTRTIVDFMHGNYDNVCDFWRSFELKTGGFSSGITNLNLFLQWAYLITVAIDRGSSGRPHNNLYAMLVGFNWMNMVSAIRIVGVFRTYSHMFMTIVVEATNVFVLMAIATMTFTSGTYFNTHYDTWEDEHRWRECLTWTWWFWFGDLSKIKDQFAIQKPEDEFKNLLIMFGVSIFITIICANLLISIIMESYIRFMTKQKEVELFEMNHMIIDRELELYPFIGWFLNRRENEGHIIWAEYDKQDLYVTSNDDVNNKLDQLEEKRKIDNQAIMKEINSLKNEANQ